LSSDEDSRRVAFYSQAELFWYEYKPAEEVSVLKPFVTVQTQDVNLSGTGYIPFNKVSGMDCYWRSLWRDPLNRAPKEQAFPLLFLTCMESETLRQKDRGDKINSPETISVHTCFCCSMSLPLKFKRRNNESAT